MKRRVEYHSTALLLLCVMCMFGSCAVGKYIPEGESLYTGATVDLEAPDSVHTRVLARVLSQAIDERAKIRLRGPGYRAFVYYRYQVEEPKGIWKKFMKFITRPVSREPVYYGREIPERGIEILKNRASNLGYFTNNATYSIDTTLRGRGIEVHYEVTVGAGYHLDSVQYVISDSSIAELIGRVSDRSRLKPGDRYSLAALKNERQRIQVAARDAGYYYFEDGDLEFLADTVSNNRKVELLLKLKDNTPASHLRPYRIDSIIVYSDFESRRDSTARYDTLFYEGLTIICSRCPLRPRVVREAFAMRNGDRYSPVAHDRTVQRLSNYNMFRYISLNYESVPGSDSLLRIRAYLSPMLRRRIEGDVGLTYNSGRYIGPETGLLYTNRNLFRGAELLRIYSDLSLAFFTGAQSETRVPRSGTYSATATLKVPRLWAPNRDWLHASLRQSDTHIEVGMDIDDLRLNLRQFATTIVDEGFDELADILARDSSATPRVTLLQLRAQYGYSWSRKQTRRHTFNPFSVRHQNPIARNQELLSLSRSIGLAHDDENLGRLDRMLLFSPNYTFLYDTRLKRFYSQNFFFSCYLSFNINFISQAGESRVLDERETSRYIQIEPDFRYYLILDNRRQIAFRLHTGIAFPLSNRVIAPYFDLYTVGGPNSVRGFIPRGIGPGNTYPEDNNLLTDGGYGNLLAEASIEFRQKLNSTFELGFFADAGNIWTYETADVPLESDFSFGNMISELGISAGVGLRLTLQSLVLRLDLAKPLQLPYKVPAGQPGDRQLKLVLGFGYPF